MALDGVAAAAALAEVPPAGLADGAAAVDPGEAAMRLLGGLQDPAAERVQALSQQQRDLEHERRRLLHERKEVHKRLKNEATQRGRMVEKHEA
jgi:septal ring factor EnvC (AmiA/AmiB activator)